MEKLTLELGQTYLVEVSEKEGGGMVLLEIATVSPKNTVDGHWWSSWGTDNSSYCADVPSVNLWLEKRDRTTIGREQRNCLLSLWGFKLPSD